MEVIQAGRLAAIEEVGAVVGNRGRRWAKPLIRAGHFSRPESPVAGHALAKPSAKC